MKDKKYFNYIVILAVLIIPFMYSFFYLKAYWDPYGEGNIDNIPVAIVNNDTGNRGSDLIKSIKDSKKLKIKTVSSKEANDGLYDNNYYAVITIPEDFTDSFESISTNNKKHATITYSPNQKSNFLASQIINNVVSAVEKNLDNTINSTIVENLSDNLLEVPNSLNTISDGFTNLQDGVGKLKDGSSKLADGTNDLAENYTKFNDGISQLKDGINTLDEETSKFSSVGSSINELQNGLNSISEGSTNFTTGLNSYVDGVDNILSYTTNLVDLINKSICPKAASGNLTAEEKNLCMIAQGLSQTSPATANVTALQYLKASGTTLKNGNNTINQGILTINSKVSNFSSVSSNIVKLQSGIKTLRDGANTLYNSSTQIKDGINTLNDGAGSLNTGIETLNSSVKNAKVELDSKISSTKEDLKKVENLAEYSKEPVKINTKEVNKVSSYGTAFSPFFISIALWVGALMMFIVLYYDKDQRFTKLGINNKNRLERTGLYHLLATLSGIILGILLYLFLDFEITNIFLYFISIVLVSNLFMAIMEFLIINFKDVGKFIALILLVLQLAAAGGTFPIETVTKGFRWLHNILPMSYTIRLLKESLMSIESNLLFKNLLVVCSLLIIFAIINILNDIYHQRKDN